MPYKYDSEGNLVIQEVNGKKLPVFVTDKGDEAPFDADGTVASIARLNAEARDNRVAKQKLEDIVKAIPEAIIKDPASAAKALETVANLNAKQLVDAGEVQKVKDEVNKAWEGKFSEVNKTVEALQSELFSEKVGGSFARSKFIADKCAIPVEFVQARFEHHFGIDNGQVYALDANNQKIYSPSNPGALANFDEALEILINANPNKDSILKGTGASGGGAGGGAGGGGGGPKGNLGGNRQERAQALAARFPELAQGGA